MADPTWDETQPIEATPTWEETAPAEPATSPATSRVTAGATGLINGATLGWAPALGSAGKTAMDAVTGTNGPLAGGSLDDLVDEYRKNRDQLRGDFAKAAAAHPVIAGAGNIVGGGAALTPLGAAAVTPGGLGITGAAMGAGGVDVNNVGDAGQAALAAGEGAAANVLGGQVVEAAAPLVGKALAPFGNAIRNAGSAIGRSAENLAVKATGATGVQASKFADGTGRELLDRGIVKFGSSPGDIAANANAAMEESGQNISKVLDQLDQKGVTVDRNTVISYLKQKKASLSGDESQVGLMNRIQGKIDDIQSQIGTKSVSVTPPPEIPNGTFMEPRPNEKFSNFQDMGDAIAGRESAMNARKAAAELEGANTRGFDPYNLQTEVEDSQIPISKAESIKRGFQDNVNWNSPAVDNNANAIASSSYRQAVEDAATQADPSLAATFKADKETYRLLSPVRDAALGRASTLQQSPVGGLLDMASAGAGAAVGGPPGAIAGLAVKQMRPRFASMGAVTADHIATVVSKTPQAFGKFASVLQSAAARGSAGVGATDYILQQTNPEYREQRKKVFSPESAPDGEPDRTLSGDKEESVQ